MDYIKKHVTQISIIAGVLITFMAVAVFIVIAFFMMENNCSNQPETSAEIAASGGTGGDWTKPGTKAYNNAKSTFDAWTQKVGTSGAAAAGIVGWINTEGGWGIVDRAEGHVGTDDESKAGVSEGVVPIPSGNYKDGGAGVYQFTPYTKYAPLRDPKWLDMAAQTEFVAKSIKSGDWIAGHDLTGGNHSFMQFAHESDPKNACKEWNAYERGASWAISKALPGKLADAETAYKIFGGANISANDSLLGAAASGATAGAAAENSSENKCSTNDDSTSDSKMVDIAKKLIGYFTYAFSRPVLKNTMSNPNSKEVSDVNKNGTTDCSGFVYLVTYLAGYKVPDGGWFTGSMYTDATGAHKYLKQVDESDAKAGDIVVCGGPNSAGAAGHTAILAENWHGMDTKIINEGGSGGDGPVNEGPFIKNFGSDLGNNQRIFCRPVSKADGSN